jgi:cell division protein FtsQ
MRNTPLLKLIAWSISLTLVALPIVGVLNGWFASERWPLRFIKVEAEFNHVSAEQIRATAAANLGAGFFAVDLDEVQRAVAKLPWVERAEARKRWPDTIELRVTELKPIARWREDRLVSATGTLFAVPGTESLQGLPMLSGPDDQLSVVLDLYMRAQKQLSGSGLVLAGAQLSERASWTLVLDNGAQIVLGRDHAEQRLSRFASVLPRLAAARGTGFERADLRYSNGFAIRWPAAPVAPPPIKKPQAAAAVAEAQA